MIKLKSAMCRESSFNSFLIALNLLLPLMISSGSLVKGSKEHHLSSVSQQTKNHTSNNSFLPSESSKIINRFTSNSTANVKRTQPNDLVNPNTHEISSSTTQQSFFDSLNRDKDPTMDASYLIGISPDSPDSNYYPSDSKLINRFRQPMLMNEYELRAQLSPMAFGQAMGNGLAQADSSGPQIYEAQTNYPMGGAANNLENSFYVNMMGAQPLANEKLQDEGASSDFPNNQYANPTNEHYSPSIHHGAHQNYIYSSGGNISPQDYAKQAYIMANQQRFDPLGQKDQITRNQKILTNAQIVSLIDELKEFNARKLKEALSGGVVSKGVPSSSRRKQSDDQQSSKINRAVSEFAKNLRKSKKSKDNDSDNDANKSNNNSNSDDDHDSDDESERREDDAKTEDDDELKKEDLQKLASFIFEQQKENNRLANARRKNSGSDSDDEDTDMRDSLLENSRKSRANEEPQSSSMKNTKQSPTDNAQLMELLKKLSTKTNVAEDSNSYEDNDKTTDREDSDKARKRRANEDTSSSTDSPKRSIDNNRSPLEGLITDNLNNYEPSAVSSAPTEKSIHDGRENWVGRKLPKLKDPVNKRVGQINEATSSLSSNEGGEEDSEYPRSERMKDLETLRESLARSREAQLKLSRIPLPLTPLFREALNNELTKVTDQTIIESSGNEDDKTDAKDANSSSSDKPEVGEESTNSDLSPSRAEPENLTKKLKSKFIDQAEEYPISETVNDRINKLSHNLDRYFNDGFLDKFENKSKAIVKPVVNQEAESRVELQVQPRKNSSKTSEKKNKTAKDDDFDINVAIDGKRDTTELEDELNGEKGDKNRKLSIQKSTKASRRVQRGLTNPGERVKKIKRLNKESGTRVNPLKARRHAINHGGAHRQKQEHHKPEKTVKPDPVDSETLDTPIGPDNKKQSKVRGIEKSKGSKEKLHSYSRNGDKFFQEPD